jgi:hypothetical protein
MKKVLLFLIAVAMCFTAARAQSFTVGDFKYSILTSDTYGTYASLGRPTDEFLNSNPTSISIPGFVTYNGQKLPVSISLRAFGDYSNYLQNVRVVWMGYGVFEIGYRAFAGLSKLSVVHIPSSVRNFLSEIFYNCGSNASNSTFIINWASLNPGYNTISENSFSGCTATNKKAYFPTFPAVAKAKNLSKLTNYFSVNNTPSPTDCYDLSTDNRYFIVTHIPTQSNIGQVTLIGVTGTSLNLSATYTNSSLGMTFWVTDVAEQACYGNTTLEEVAITATSITVSKQAFALCPNLTWVNVGAGLIMEEAFYDCYNLATVYLDGAAEVRPRAFAGTKITTLNIPASMDTFDPTAVERCYNLEKFTVASGNSKYATYVNNGTNYGALYSKDLKTLVKVPPHNAYTAAAAFPTQLTTINNHAFSYNNLAGWIELPYGVTTIGKYAFMNATSPKGIKIPSSVTSFDYGNAFSGCSNLKRLLISSQANMSNANSFTFEGVPSSMTVYVPPFFVYTDIPYCYSAWSQFNITYGAWDVVVNGMPYVLTTAVADSNYPNQLLARLVYGVDIYEGNTDISKKLSGAITIPETFSYNGKTYRVEAVDYAFKGNTNITSATINGKIQGKEIFRNCTGLTNFSFGTKWSTISNIGEYCFKNTRIQYAYLPYGVGLIGDQAFADNPSLKEIKVPSSSPAGYLSTTFFRNCTALEKVYINSPEAPYSEYSGSEYSPGTGCFYGVPKSCKIYVPVGARTSFYNCKNTGGYYHWRYFNSIEAGAYDWQDLTVTQKNSDGSFNAKQVYIPDNTIQYFTISDNTYKSDNYGRRYYIKELSDSCFAGATQLTGVNVMWSNNILKKIPRYAFVNCTSLTSFKWPDKSCKLNYIGEYAFAWTAIQGVVDLTKCNDTKLDIQNNAFSITPNVTHFKLPANVDRLGTFAMGQLSGTNPPAALTSVTCLATNPPTNLGTQVWTPALQPNQTLYVPKASINKYKAAAQWKNFGHILAEGGIPGDVNGDGFVTSGDVTALYSYMLNNDSSQIVNGDVDGDGHITAGDITALYTILLGQ